MEGGTERAMDRLSEGDMGRRTFHNYHSLIAEGVTSFYFFKCVLQFWSSNFINPTYNTEDYRKEMPREGKGATKI